MASVFTYQEDVKRIHSPWSTPGNRTPQGRGHDESSTNLGWNVNGITRLEPEKQDGPCEYKLHLLLRARRKFITMTTASDATSYLQAKSSSAALSGVALNEGLFQKSSYQPSPQTRQARLQQLTTQLLWRLQQSSPFHSSSNSQLVLPVLPEATPRLGVPERPAKLLPGLEESQGALYELGVADDGTLVGLVEDELDESLNNLRAMAASLGCVCEILLKSMIGQCEWEDVGDETTENLPLRGQLFVAEVLVRPDSRAAPDIASPSRLHDPGDTIFSDAHTQQPSHDVEQLRIAFAGSSTAGKSSLVGTLTTSMLDNGRGKSRLSLLKHRHEIASGVTSSVAHELIGYKVKAESDDSVVNYATGDVSSWTDTHNLANRLCFLIDSPGLARYAKSIFRSLVSWEPHWVFFCIAADEGDDPSMRSANPSSTSIMTGEMSMPSEMSLAHLALSLRLDLPIIVTITKMDLATKSGLRLVLGRVLSALKMAGRHPMMLSAPSVPMPSFALDSNQALPDLQHISLVEQEEIEHVVDVIEKDHSRTIVPILMTSSVTGSGIGKLHRLLGDVPMHSPEGKPSRFSENQKEHSPLFHIDEVFSIPPSRVYSADTAARLEAQGVVLCGRLRTGKIATGDQLRIGPLLPEDTSTNFAVHRSKSYSSHDIRRTLTPKSISIAKSLQDNDGDSSHLTKPNPQAVFATVRVVSLRNLRLPVLIMQPGETGTIGIELVNDMNLHISLQRARKGMVLLGPHHEARAYRSFIATFPATDFVSSSPLLILGGHAIAYVESVRAAVKVVAVALADEEGENENGSGSGSGGGSPAEVFAFEDDDEVGAGAEEQRHEHERGHEKTSGEIKITFRFGTTLEWLEVGGRVLVVPTVSASGPVAGNAASAGVGVASTSVTASASGLVGFVGRVCEVLE